MIAKTRTGIKGLDKLIDGGIPKGKNILLSGSPGTGKTIFSLEFLYKGYKKYKEKGLYVSFEENKDNLEIQAKMFGWNIDELKENVKIICIDPKDIKENTIKDIVKIVENGNYKRLVIDSLSALAINTPTTFVSATEITSISIQRFLYQFISRLREIKATTILISQTGDKLSNDGVSEFVCDGIINIKYEAIGGDFSRHLIVRKMRQVKNDEDIHPMEISSDGIVIHNFDL